MKRGTLIIPILLMLLSHFSTASGQAILWTCPDECIEDTPVQKNQTFEISALMALDEPIQCSVKVTWNEAEVCPLEGGGCVFELVEISYPDACESEYTPEDIYYYALLAFLLSRYDDGCFPADPSGCVDNVRLYTGECAKRVYDNGEWKLQSCLGTEVPCCKSVYQICYVNFRWQLRRVGYHSGTPTCPTFGLPWNQFGAGCYPVCEFLPEDWDGEFNPS